MELRTFSRSKKQSVCGAVMAVAALVFPALAHATVVCTGAIGYLGIGLSGDVVVANGSAINVICNAVTQGSYQVNPQACKIFYATLLANRLAGRGIAIYYNDPALTSCSQITSWSSQPSAYFLEHVN